MLKPNDYDQTPCYGEYKPIELGGHICVIKSVEEMTSSTGKPMLLINLDTAPQDKQPGFYAEQWRNDTRENKKWGCRVFQMVSDKDGKTNKGFKTFCTSVEKSNNGFSVQWGDGFSTCFKNKLVGGVFGREEYIGTDGVPHWATKCVQFRSVEAIKNGVEIPKDKALSPVQNHGRTDFSDAEEISTEDLPF